MRTLVLASSLFTQLLLYLWSGENNLDVLNKRQVDSSLPPLTMMDVFTL